MRGNQSSMRIHKGWWGTSELRRKEIDDFANFVGYDNLLNDEIDEIVFWRAFLEGLLYGEGFARDYRYDHEPK